MLLSKLEDKGEGVKRVVHLLALRLHVRPPVGKALPGHPLLRAPRWDALILHGTLHPAPRCTMLGDNEILKQWPRPSKRCVGR